jgi:HEAT repeat protein
MSAIADLVRHVDTARAEVIDTLEKCLESDKDPTVRAAAADGLGACLASESLSRLLVAVEDKDASVRQSAIMALGEIRDPRALGRLSRALDDERPDVRFQAIMAFVRVSDSKSEVQDALLRATKDKDDLVVHIALRMCEEARVGEEDDSPPRPFDPRLVERAVSLLKSKSVRVRTVAAIVAAEADRDEALPAIASLLASDEQTPEHDDLTHLIALAGERRVIAAEATLLRLAFGAKFGVLRHPFAWHARLALAQLGNEQAIAAIGRDLSAFSRDKRNLAVASVGRARLENLRPLVEAMRGDARRAEPYAVDEALEMLDRPSKS